MRFGRYCAAGFLFDALKFVFLAVATLRAKQLGASSTELALLLTVYTFVYVPSCLLLGRRADRGSKAAPARWGVALGVGSCALAAAAGRLLVLDLAVAGVALASSLFWPSIQGALGAETDPSRLEKALGAFNVSWSLGKSLGFAMAGWTFARLGATATFLAAAGAAVPVLLLVPGDAPGRAAAPDGERRESPVLFRTLAYIANFASYGLGATLLSQYPKYLQAYPPPLSGPETFYGIFMATVFGAQTLCFVVLQFGKAWTYRRGPLYLAQVVAAGAAFALVLSRIDAIALALVAPLVGAGIGFVGASSIYYSLHGPADHAKYAGVHEAVLGVSTFLIPLAAGRLADLTGDLRIPYALAAAAVVAALPLQEFVYRRSSRS